MDRQKLLEAITNGKRRILIGVTLHDYPLVLVLVKTGVMKNSRAKVDVALIEIVRICGFDLHDLIELFCLLFLSDASAIAQENERHLLTIDWSENTPKCLTRARNGLFAAHNHAINVTNDCRHVLGSLCFLCLACLLDCLLDQLLFGSIELFLSL